jgi:hypothetical protein
MIPSCRSTSRCSSPNSSDGLSPVAAAKITIGQPKNTNPPQERIDQK